MKDYFKRLKTHPGVNVAIMMTILGFLAGATNKSVTIYWQGGLVGMVFVGGVCWIIVLISNIKK